MKTLILLLEDNPLIRENITEMLILKDFEVMEGANGKEGLKIIIEQLPDLILCDIMMPELDGYEFLSEIKKNNITSKIPFIFISAITEKKEIQVGLDLGADAYITKPFDQEEMLNKIEYCLQLKKV